MATFITFDYNLFLKLADIAVENETRIMPSSPKDCFRLESFNKKHKIDMEQVNEAIYLLHGSKINVFIIEKGRGEGYYILCTEKRFCYKYRKKDTIMFEKNNWGSSNW